MLKNSIFEANCIIIVNMAHDFYYGSRLKKTNWTV